MVRVVIRNCKFYQIVAVEETYGGNLEITVQPIPQEVNWLDCRFDRPSNFEGREFRKSGNSSIQWRNYWVCDVPTEAVEVEVWDVPASEFDLRDGQFSCWPSQVHKSCKKIIIKSVDFVRRLNEYLLSVALEEVRRLIKIDRFTEVTEANKAPWYEFLEVLDGRAFLVLGEHFTTRGNTTLLLHPVNSVLRVPKKYMGLVIGKKGSNIQALRKKYGIDFRLKEAL